MNKNNKENSFPFYGSVKNTEISFISSFLRRLGEKNFPENPSYLNSIFNHFEIMNVYLTNLLKRRSFQELVTQATGYQETQDMENFLTVLVYSHDYGRLIIPPGSLDLREFDKLSEKLLNDFLSSIYNQEEVEKIKACLHSIDWITGEKELPESDDRLSSQQRLALILKAIDTIGKSNFDERGRFVFRHPDIFFDEDGDYQRWLEYQKDNHRFPIPLGDGRFIDAEEYVARDRELTLRGVNLIKQILSQESAEAPGEEFDAFWLEVQQEFAKLHPNL